jgi:hypothetical protein
MDRRREERSLRRLVAGLARARREDVDAVLDELSPDHRRVVRDLLDAYQGQPAPRYDPERPKATVDTLDLRGFSPAIAERLALEGGGRPRDWRMTDAAAAALRASARQLPPEPVIALAPVGRQRRVWFLGGAR